MNTLEHAEKLINEIQNQLANNERVAKESIEKIHKQIEAHRNHAEEQIERIHKQVVQEAESAEEHIQRLHNGLTERQRSVEERIQRIQEESEEHHRFFAEHVERVCNQVEQARGNAEGQVERIREQMEQKTEFAQEEIERIREQAEEFRNSAAERVESIREQIEEHKDTLENRTERFHVETDTWAESHSTSEPVQSLQDRFDMQYNEHHAAATISQSHVMNGVEILKYSGKLLPLSEMDARYPRSEWLQTLLDKHIVIENLHDYCRYLNARDMLMRIEKRPHVWTSGLFDIPSTENWETYQETYINQLANPKKAPHV